jgi:hypothetical protein
VHGFLPLGKSQRTWLAPLICRGGCYFCLDTKVTKKSSQADRCHHTGHTPGRAPWQAFALLFIIAILLIEHHSSAAQLWKRAGKIGGIVRRHALGSFSYSSIF